MSPPPDKTSSYLQMLQRDMAERSAEHEEHRRLKREIELKKLQLELANLSATPKPVTPKRKPLDIYEAQITAWYSRLPPAARNSPRAMEEFINLLDGRTPGMKAHAPDVSRILSRLGWVRRRIWKADGEGRRVWILPV